MKTVKKILKPFWAPVVLLGVCCLKVVKKAIVSLKFKNQYKNISKINHSIQKMYSLVFNPYRIPNGIFPRFHNKYQCSASDLEKCHELFLKKRQNA